MTPSHPNGVAAIILAAGASQRMGTPKALLDFQGETFIARLVRVMSRGCDTVVVVLGHQAEAIRPYVPNRARIVVNPDPARGQLSSLQAALAELASSAQGFAFIPVDCPAVAEGTVERLAALFAQRRPETKFVIPRIVDASGKAKRGHPVFASHAVADELLALPPNGEARTIVHRYVPDTQYLDVTDPGIFTDIDTPEAYQQLLAAIGRPAEAPR